MSERDGARGPRLLLGAATVALGGLVLSPLARADDWDSFPISSYPMFSRDAGKVRALAHVQLVEPGGARRPAPPALVGSPEPMVATALVAAHVERGTARELCAEIAARARASGEVEVEDGAAVEILVSAFDTRRYLSNEPGGRTPIARQVHARCEVRGQVGEGGPGP